MERNTNRDSLLIMSNGIGREQKNNKIKSRVKKYKSFYIMFAPIFLFFIVFHYIPMAGIGIAFYDYGLFGIKDFIGMENFKIMFSSPKFFQVLKNTLILSFLNLFIGMSIAIIFALLLNELRDGSFKKLTQTVAYLPHFLSWVVVASIFTMLLSPQTGIVNAIIKYFGGEPIYFLISEEWWRSIFIFIHQWKETGWATIVYLAAITNIDPTLYEAATVDGAGKLKQTWYITIPGIQTTILIVFIMNLSKILNIFQPVFVLQNPLVYNVSDVIGTYTYRVGLLQSDYDYSTAVGLFKSLVSMILVLMANSISKRVRGESIL